ncbi:hypothetical protein P9112_012309 [Eukaryota sp. TZLM1-RC]
MSIIDLELSSLHVTYVFWGLIAASFGLFGRIFRTRLMISAALYSLLWGLLLSLILSTITTGLVNTERLILKEITKAVASIQVFVTMLYLPPHFYKRRWREITALLTLHKVITSFISFGLLTAIFGSVSGVSWLWYLTLASLFSITDPVLVTEFFKGHFAQKHYPCELRFTLLFETSANDGFGWLYVTLPLAFLIWPQYGVPSVLLLWFVRFILWETVLGGLLGFLVGFGGAKLFKISEERNWFDRSSFIGFTVALTLLMLGLSLILNLNALIAVLIGGITFSNNLRGSERGLESQYQDSLDSLLNYTVFLLFGLFIPWVSFGEIGLVRLLLLAVGLFLFQRSISFFIITKTFSFTHFSNIDKVYTGLFNPIGSSAIFWAIRTEELIPSPIPIVEITYWVIIMSVLVFGTISSPLIYLYKRLQPQVTAINREIYEQRLVKTEEEDLNDLRVIQSLWKSQDPHDQSKVNQLRRKRELFREPSVSEFAVDSIIDLYEERFYQPKRSKD